MDSASHTGAIDGVLKIGIRPFEQGLCHVVGPAATHGDHYRFGHGSDDVQQVQAHHGFRIVRHDYYVGVQADDLSKDLAAVVSFDDSMAVLGHRDGQLRRVFAGDDKDCGQ